METANIKTTLYLLGNFLETSNRWLEWNNFAMDKLSSLGFSANYFGACSSQTFKGDKIIQITNPINAKRLQHALEAKESFTHLDFFVLPEKFKSAFDYTASIMCGTQNIKKTSYIIISLPRDNFDENKTLKLKDDLEKFIKPSSGKIFELDVKENPNLYIWELKTKFKTLNVLKEF